MYDYRSNLIGSSINLSKRMNEHFICSTNVHLRNAIIKYGSTLGALFYLVEFVEIISDVSPLETKALILSREQIYLDWLFTLPESLRYNFRRFADSSIGYLFPNPGVCARFGVQNGKSTAVLITDLTGVVLR